MQTQKNSGGKHGVVACCSALLAAPKLDKCLNMSPTSTFKSRDVATRTHQSAQSPNRDMTAPIPKVVFTPERVASHAVSRGVGGTVGVKRKHELGSDKETGNTLDNIMGNITDFYNTRCSKPFKRGVNDDDAAFTYSTGISLYKQPNQFLAPGVQRSRYHCVNEDCNEFNSFITDPSGGTVSCKNCGCVQPNKLFVEEESRLFADDDPETRSNKVRAESGTATTTVTEKRLGLTNMKLYSVADKIKNEMFEFILDYSEFMNPGNVTKEVALFGPREISSEEKEVSNNAFACMARHIEKIQLFVNQIATAMNTPNAVKRHAEKICLKFGVQLFIHDRDCCDKSCRIRKAKKIEPPLAAAALLREAQIHEMGDVIQFEVYKSTLQRLNVPTHITENLGKASSLILDTFKGMPFPCSNTFDPGAARYLTIGRKERIEFSDISMLSQNIGFSYPQTLRAKEILDDWKDPPPFMPQTLMGMAFIRTLEETQAAALNVKAVSKLVGITEATLTKRCSDRHLLFPTRILDELVKKTDVGVAVGVCSRGLLLAWLGTTSNAFRSYNWTRAAGPWIAAMCALLAGVLEIDPVIDVKAIVDTIVSVAPPGTTTSKKIVELFNTHPKLVEISL